MRKIFIRVVVAAGAMALSVGLTGGPAEAGTTVDSHSSAPRAYGTKVAKGHRLQVATSGGGSKILSRKVAFYKGAKRVGTKRPKPGVYRAKVAWRYQLRYQGTQDYWVADEYCDDGYYDYVYHPEIDDYIYEWVEGECYDDGYWDYRDVSWLSGVRKKVQWVKVRVSTDETPGCVSRTEFRAVKDGMTVAQVHRIFGTRGTLSYAGSSGVGREYATCSGNEWSYVDVDYSWSSGAHRVWFKWQYIDY